MDGGSGQAGRGGQHTWNRAALLASLPVGAEVRDDGTVNGTTTLDSFSGMFPRMTGIDNPTFSEIMQYIGDKSLAKNGTELTNGLIVGSQSAKDLYRMDLNFMEYSSIEIRKEYEAEIEIRKEYEADQKIADVSGPTNASIAQAMLDRLTRGNKNALRVLTSVVNQQFSTPFVRGAKKPDGTTMEPKVAGKAAGKVSVGTATGAEPRDPGGIGDARIDIQRPENGNYQVDILYPFTMTQPTMDHGDRFAGLGDTGIQGTGRVSYFVDGHAADDGKLSVIENGPATITWDGHMSL